MYRRTLGRSLIACAFGLVGILGARGQEPTPPFPAFRHNHQPSASRLANVEEIRKQLGLTPAYDNLPGIESLKVAVLDYGFDGIKGSRRYLPEDTVVVENYDPEFVRRFNLGDTELRKPFAAQNAHGRTMAQIIWAVTGFNPRGPKFYLLNANGPTMLRRAVRYAIENKIDIILFSNTFEGGGNGDGRGPVNRIVADALAAGIIWINAAGNFGGHVYNGPVEILPDGYLRLGEAGGIDGQRSPGSALRFRNLLDENSVTITLTWNDYREKEDAGTTKDLDLFVEDHMGNVVGSSEKRQVVGGTSEPEESRNPRERVVLTDLSADADHDYFIRIRAKSGTFTADDRIRVLVTSSREGFLDAKTGAPTESLRFADASRKGEIYPPADNPLVLTVGDRNPESAVGPTADHRRKPDILLEESHAAFTNGDLTFGASNAAAYFAGVVVLLKAAEPELSTRHLLWLAHNDKTTQATTDGGSAERPPGSPEPRQSSTGSSSSRRSSLGRRLANLAASAPLQNSAGPLQIRAPYFEFYLDPSRQLPASPAGSARQSYYSPLRIRAAGVELNLPPRNSSAARPPVSTPGGGGNGSSAKVRQPEHLRPPHKADESQPATQEAQNFIWRTPTREHLAEVVHR
jgi:hypothetical protein